MAQRTFGSIPDPQTGARYTRDPNTGAGPTSQAGTEMPRANSANDLIGEQRMGWVDGTAAAVSNPQGSAWTPIGPGSAIFARGRDGQKFTARDQKGSGRKR